jgi:ribosome-binding factor A
MSERRQRVEELLRRAVSEIVLFGELRDPRLRPSAAIGVTGVRVSPDLGSARVFIDVLSSDLQIEAVLEGLTAGIPAIRRALSKKVRMRRVPNLRFERDMGIETGQKIEQIVQELGAPASEAADEEAADEDTDPELREQADDVP